MGRVMWKFALGAHVKRRNGETAGVVASRWRSEKGEMVGYVLHADDGSTGFAMEHELVAAPRE